MSEMNYLFMDAEGRITYNMTNDYMFRVVLQKNKRTLKYLIASLLHLATEQIKDVRIENPINLSDDINGKEYHMDVAVTLNDNTFINLEMQVVNYDNWPERSLSYLCRKFDHLSRGENYKNVKPVYHIGFLDFELFTDHPEFFARYQVRNILDGHLYTDKFNLYVVQLGKTDLATNEDKAFNIDVWARLFKANTWEEIKMITKDNETLKSTAESIYESNSDWITLEKCRAREDAIRQEQYQANRIKELEVENAKLRDLLEKNGIKM